VTAIRLLIGLANPGGEYELTRHNAGAWYIRDLADSAMLSLSAETKLKCATVKYAPSTLLAVPLTFMNHSGQALQAIMHYYKITPEEIIVAHDDIDLPPGTIKIKEDGGHGGHNGLRDIFKHLGTQRFWRLRIGVGRPEHTNQVTNFVLKAPSKGDQQLIDDALIEAQRITPLLIQGDFQEAMLQLHTR
jgi:PTH1 family peptidyl-tRNA hydrolase